LIRRPRSFEVISESCFANRMSIGLITTEGNAKLSDLNPRSFHESGFSSVHLLGSIELLVPQGCFLSVSYFDSISCFASPALQDSASTLAGTKLRYFFSGQSKTCSLCEPFGPRTFWSSAYWLDSRSCFLYGDSLVSIPLAINARSEALVL
jgi:hypothetical protein